MSEYNLNDFDKIPLSPIHKEQKEYSGSDEAGSATLYPDDQNNSDQTDNESNYSEDPVGDESSG